MSESDHASNHGLSRPTLSDAREAVHRVHVDAGPTVWGHLLSSAKLAGEEADTRSFERLLCAMGTADPVTRLCGEALLIRMASHTRLVAASAAASAAASGPPAASSNPPAAVSNPPADTSHPPAAVSNPPAAVRSQQ